MAGSLSCAWLTVCFTALCAVAPAGQIASSGSSTASISGKVVDAVSTSPLRSATVTLEDEGGTQLRRSLTEDAGRFSFSDLPPGTFHVIASKPGYVRAEFGERGLGLGVPIVVVKGQLVSNLSVRLVKAASISGRLLDRNQEAAASVVVAAIAVDRDARGDGIFNVVASAVTDDTGAYRLFGLRAGEYLVAATRFQPPASAMQRRGPMTIEGLRDLWRPVDFRVPVLQSEFAPVFFPGTAEPGQAQTVSLASGEERSGLSFEFDVHGSTRVEGATGPSAAFGAVQVVAFAHGATPTSALKEQRAQTATRVGSRFVLADLTPGDYTLVVSAASAGTSLRDHWSVAKLTLHAGDVTLLSVIPEKGSRVRGRLVAASSEGNIAGFGRVAMRFSSLRQDGLDFVLPPVVSAADGTFETVVPPGRYVVDLVGDIGRGPRPRWALSGIRRPDRPGDRSFALEVDHDLDGLTFALEEQNGRITGKVIGSDGQPAVDYFVMAFSTDSSRWTSSLGVLDPQRPDTNGEFHFESIAAAEYYLAAVPRLDEHGWWSDAVRRALIPNAVRVRVSPGGTAQQVLRVAGTER